MYSSRADKPPIKPLYNPETAFATHARSGRKGSKSSGSFSFDFGYPHRLAFGKRSASFDQGSIMDRASVGVGAGAADRKRAVFGSFGDLDVAPEPTVPAGPRRIAHEPQQPSPLPPQPNYAPPSVPPAPRRKSSVRSSTTMRTLRKNKSQPEQNMRMQAQEFVQAHAAGLRNLPPVPTVDDPPAPSPTVATRKKATVAPTASGPSTPKEKPGFFRRVFGSRTASHSSTTQPESSPTSGSVSSTPHNARGSSAPSAAVSPTDGQPRPKTTPSSANHIASQLKALPKVPPASPSPQVDAPTPTPVLAKKTSSFFRRRKKSVTEAPPPPLPLDKPSVLRKYQPPPDILPAQPSPSSSSLRKVMSPYLNDLGSRQRGMYSPHPSSAGQERIAGGNAAKLSPGYQPHKDAAAHAVRPDSHDTEGSPPSSRGELPQRQAKYKLRIKRGRTANPVDDSFLVDSSSTNTEERSRERPRQRPVTSPTSVSATPTSASKRGELLGIPADPGSASASVSGPASASGSTAKSSPMEAEDDGWVLTAPPQKEQDVARAGRGDSPSANPRLARTGI